MTLPKLNITQILSLITILVMLLMMVIVLFSHLFDPVLPGWRRWAFAAVIGLYAVIRLRRITKQLKS
jgi:membrane protein YdbS with pleckstrin-like domain